jgi:small neutral amino acid transporter SnatA (MarC family)
MALLATTYFLLTFTALLPLINPVGSALVLLGHVGDETPAVYPNLARRVAITMFGFLLTLEYLGSYPLGFFSLSLPIVQVTGGLVIASNAWRLLFEKDANAHVRGKHQEIGANSVADVDDLNGKIFYPFTFPITAGPGALVVILALNARTIERLRSEGGGPCRRGYCSRRTQRPCVFVLRVWALADPNRSGLYSTRISSHYCLCAHVHWCSAHMEWARLLVGEAATSLNGLWFTTKKRFSGLKHSPSSTAREMA